MFQINKQIEEDRQHGLKLRAPGQPTNKQSAKGDHEHPRSQAEDGGHMPGVDNGADHVLSGQNST